MSASGRQTRRLILWVLWVVGVALLAAWLLLPDDGHVGELKGPCLLVLVVLLISMKWFGWLDFRGRVLRKLGCCEKCGRELPDSARQVCPKCAQPLD